MSQRLSWVPGGRVQRGGTPYDITRRSRVQQCHRSSATRHAQPVRPSRPLFTCDFISQRRPEHRESSQQQHPAFARNGADRDVAFWVRESRAASDIQTRLPRHAQEGVLARHAFTSISWSESRVMRVLRNSRVGVWRRRRITSSRVRACRASVQPAVRWPPATLGSRGVMHAARRTVRSAAAASGSIDAADRSSDSSDEEDADASTDEAPVEEEEKPKVAKSSDFLVRVLSLPPPRAVPSLWSRSHARRRLRGGWSGSGCAQSRVGEEKVCAPVDCSFCPSPPSATPPAPSRYRTTRPTCEWRPCQSPVRASERRKEAASGL